MEVVVNGQVRVVEVGTDAYEVVVAQAPVQVVTVGVQGPAGPPGPTSPGTTFVWDQGTPSTVWTIRHNLGQYPSVTVVDSGKSLIIGEVQYLDQNTLAVSFTVPTGGFAFLN